MLTVLKMRVLVLLFSICMCGLPACLGDILPNGSLRFPDGFLFGTASASYQVEGAWDVHGKAESIWDHMTHSNPASIRDQSSGDVACNSYYMWERDIEMLLELGVQYYRFSISWPRILPNAPSTTINQPAVDYYNRLIDTLISYNIEPVITIFHWDLPQSLQDLGGWTNPEIVHYFTDFADVAFRLFGDRVKKWITINEPKQICLFGYGNTVHAPQIGMSGFAEYLCTKNVLLSHASAYRLYNETYKPTQGGICGITTHTQYYQPESNSQEDVDAAADAEAFEAGLYLHPIFSQSGDWPERVKTRVNALSSRQGYTRSRLPTLTPEEISYIRHTSDFLGANSYANFVVKRGVVTQGPSYYHDMNAVLTHWPETRSQTDFWALYRMFIELKSQYGDWPIYMFENGMGTSSSLDDYQRGQYYQQAVGAVRAAIEDGVDIRAYTAWTFMDNFEWSRGYTVRYGMYFVDFSDESRPRTPKTSAFVYRRILRDRHVDPHYWPNSTEVIGETTWGGYSSGVRPIFSSVVNLMFPLLCIFLLYEL